jgi:hypothetical protein
MASIVKLLTENSNDKNEIKSQVELNGEPFKTFKFKTESLYVKHQASIISIKNIGGDILIWGNDAFGIWGNYYWGDSASQSFILGLSKLGINALGDTSSDFERIRIVPPNDSFEEEFIGDYFINTTSTTAAYSSKNLFFNLTSEQLESNLIYSNSTSVVTATISIVSTSGIDNFSLYLSNDGGTSWESASNSEEHTFSNALGEQVKYKILSNAVGKYINKVVVKIN